MNEAPLLMATVRQRVNSCYYSSFLPVILSEAKELYVQ
jgi:hypothetical protein